MSFLASLPSFFSGNNQAAAPDANTQAQGTDPQATQKNTAPTSPLDNFSELWQNDANNGTETTTPEALFNVDPKALNEAVGKMNFLGNIPPKVQEALKAGGEEAVRANLYLMNQVAQQSYAQSAQSTAAIVEAALAKQAETFEAKVSDIIRKTSVSQELADTNPVFKHAAAAPILQGLQAQLQKKHPNATPAELATMANQFLKSFADEVTGANKPKASVKDGTDFSDFF